MNRVQTEMADERRAWFRIDDNARLVYRTRSADEIVDIRGRMAGGQYHPFGVRGEIAFLNAEISRLRSGLGGCDPGLLKLLDAMNTKLDALFTLIGKEQGSGDLSGSVTEVNIGAGGLAFSVDVSPGEARYLEMLIYLEPGNATVTALAEIVGCEETGKGYRLSANFIEISDADRDVLVKHVLRKQANRLLERRRPSAT